MKTLQEIENTSFERLEQIAGDTGISVPEGLRASVKDSVAAAALASAKPQQARRPLWRPALILSLAAAACLAVLFAIPRAPQDTYDDPLIAYAKVEETFALISSKLDVGVESLRQAEEPLETVNRILNKK